mgnify:CR=1 FL=1
MSNRTFTMIKPEAVAAGNTGKIIDMITSKGFKVIALKYTRLSKDEAGIFCGELGDYMACGPIVAAILEKNNAVSDFRTLIGATDPAEAAEGTLRKRFAESKAKNAVHGSDSDQNAVIEGNFFFSGRERY